MDWKTEVEFCPPIGEVNIDVMAKFLAHNVFKSKDNKFSELLHCRYKQLRGCFKDVQYDKNVEWDLNDKKKWGLVGCGGTNVADKKKKDARLRVPLGQFEDLGVLCQFSCEDNLGHDMPIWIKKNQTDSRTEKIVMMVAQDPLRNGDAQGALYLSTPFGMHCCDWRNGKNGRVVKRLIDDLIKDPAIAVYLTDYNKLFAREKGFVKNNYPELYSGFSDVLIEEVNKLKGCLKLPLVIVTFGVDASEIFCRGIRKNFTQHMRLPCEVGGAYEGCGVFDEVPTLAFIHPSGTACGHIKRLFTEEGQSGDWMSAYYSWICARIRWQLDQIRK